MDITISKTIQGQPTCIAWVCKLFFPYFNILLLCIRNFLSTFNFICWVLDIFINIQLRNYVTQTTWICYYFKFVYNNLTPSFEDTTNIFWKNNCVNSHIVFEFARFFFSLIILFIWSVCTCTCRYVIILLLMFTLLCILISEGHRHPDDIIW